MTDCPHRVWKILQSYTDQEKGIRVYPERCKDCGAERDLVENLKKKGRFGGVNQADRKYTPIRYPEKTVIEHSPKEDETVKTQSETEPTGGRKRGPYRRSKGVQYYLENKAKIKADYYREDMTVPLLLEKWGMPKSVWYKLRPQILGEVPEQPTKGDTPGNTSSATENNDILGGNLSAEKVDTGHSDKLDELKAILEPMTPAQRRAYYLEHKEELIENAGNMTSAAIRRKWLMGEKGWLSLRHLWGLPVNSPIVIKLDPVIAEFVDLITEVSNECQTIEEFRAFLKGYKRAKGWNSAE